MLDQMEAVFAGRARVVKAEMDKSPQNRRSVSREVQATHVGMASKVQLTKMIEVAV
jgi:hypothetical protein